MIKSYVGEIQLTTVEYVKVKKVQHKVYEILSPAGTRKLTQFMYSSSKNIMNHAYFGYHSATALRAFEGRPGKAAYDAIINDVSVEILVIPPFVINPLVLQVRI